MQKRENDRENEERERERRGNIKEKRMDKLGMAPRGWALNHPKIDF